MSIDQVASAEIEEWRADLGALYASIEEWAGAMELPPQIAVHRITLNEEPSGPYEVDELVLTQAGHQMKVRPVARWVSGAEGRVDLVGTEGPFILVNLMDRGGWHYLADRPTSDLRPLDGVLFRRLASTCLR